MPKIVFITGATAGFGKACAEKFAANGYDLILNGRRTDRLETISTELENKFNIAVLQLPFDVRDKKAVFDSINNIPADWQQIDVLINNAGLALGRDFFDEADTDDWDTMIDTNVKGLLYVTRAIVPGMVARGSGHVVNLGSIAGHQTYPQGNVYCATKAAVRSISEGLKIDLLGTPIRVTSVDPGLVDTEFSTVRFHGDKSRAAKVYQGLTPLTATDIAETILFCITRPAHVNISEILLVPTDQATPTLVHRRD